MADISELDQEAQWLRVSWKKANNYYSAFAAKLIENKKKFDNGMYPGWTFAMWLGQKAGLGEDQILKQLNNFTNVIASEERDRIIAENKRIELEARQARLLAEQEKARLIAATKEERDKVKAIKDADAANKKNNDKAKRLSNAAKKGAQTKRENRAKFVPNADKNLGQLASDFHNGDAKVKQSDIDFVNGTMEMAIALAFARKQLSDADFKDWLKQENITHNKDNIGALINFGLNPEAVRKGLEKTDRRSPRYIWEELKPTINVISIA